MIIPDGIAIGLPSYIRPKYLSPFRLETFPVPLNRFLMKIQDLVSKNTHTGFIPCLKGNFSEKLKPHACRPSITGSPGGYECRNIWNYSKGSTLKSGKEINRGLKGGASDLRR
jgi:hypothetical protein